MLADTLFVAWLLLYINVFDAFMIEWLAGAVRCKNCYVGSVDHLIASLLTLAGSGVLAVTIGCLEAKAQISLQFRGVQKGNSGQDLLAGGWARRRSTAGVIMYKICL